MSEDKPTYEELERRCRDAEAMLEAIHSGRAETVMGKDGPLAIRLAQAEAENSPHQTGLASHSQCQQAHHSRER